MTVCYVFPYCHTDSDCRTSDHEPCFVTLYYLISYFMITITWNFYQSIACTWECSIPPACPCTFPPALLMSNLMWHVWSPLDSTRCPSSEFWTVCSRLMILFVCLTMILDVASDTLIALQMTPVCWSLFLVNANLHQNSASARNSNSI